MPNLNDMLEVAEVLEGQSVAPIPERCVAVRNRNSKCRRCMEVCLGDAITVENNDISVDTSRCVDCGCCIAVCPTGALLGLDPLSDDLARTVAQAVGQTGEAAYIACARMASRGIADPDKYATVPCLGRLEEELLVSLAVHGVCSTVLVDGGCESCKYGAASPCIDDTVASALSLLGCAGSEASIARVSEFPPELADDQGKSARASRRSFFTQAGTMARDAAVTMAEKALAEKLGQQKKEKTLRDRLGLKGGAKMPTIDPDRNMALLDGLDRLGGPVEPELFTRVFGSVTIDPEPCSGCGMCIMFCPTDALSYNEDPALEDEESEYRLVDFSAADCTQCGLCRDACLRGAIEVSPVVDTAELFDFEPRLISIKKPPKRGASLFDRRRP